MGGFTRDFVLLISLLLLLPLTGSATSLQDALGNITAALGIGDVHLPHPKTVAAAWKDLVTLLDAHRGDSKQAALTLKSYFSRFGYLNASSISKATMHFDDELEAAVRLYQQNFKLRVTGTLDLATIAQLVKPRCGREDVLSGISQMVRSNRSTTLARTVQRYSFFTGQPKWTSSKHLTYFIDYPSLPRSNSLSADQVQAAIRNAFSGWSDIVPLMFSETSRRSNADINIGFGSFDHGDNQPFDGPLGVVAHAFPPEDGRLHFDASETWVTDVKSVDPIASFTAMHFESVATHEIGHLIGLGHSNDETAIMFPSIEPGEVRTSFSEDDIQGAQQLYGSYQPGSLQGTDYMIVASGDIGPRRQLWWWTGLAATIAVLLTGS